MLLKFGADHYASLGRESYLRRLIAIIQEHFPGLAAEFDEEALADGLWEQTLLAKRYGLDDERSAATFALTAWLLGKGFDRNIPALRQILESDQLSPTRKAQALLDFTQLLFHQLEGGVPAIDKESR
ncbi:MAG: hypothetical protein RLZZ555_544 [Pseudomonadota bacterium]|jgi:hypothetical protein